MRVTGTPAGLTLWRGAEQLANGTSGGEYNFRGLQRGLYMLKVGGKSWPVLVNGDQTLDLAGKTPTQGSSKKIIGIVLILAINLIGILAIIRIIRKEISYG